MLHMHQTDESHDCLRHVEVRGTCLRAQIAGDSFYRAYSKQYKDEDEARDSFIRIADALDEARYDWDPSKIASIFEELTEDEGLELEGEHRVSL